jgi:FKBP-type peptidyl-prolyl cis-trans isomerase (trigger factor)
MYSGNNITLGEKNLDVKLRHCEAEIFNIAKKYGISSVEEFENQYKRGELEEEGTWEDFFKRDHLEAEKDSLKKALDLTTNC